MKTAYHHIKEKYLSEYCFSGAYILSLLENGYEFTENNWQMIHFLGKVCFVVGRALPQQFSAADAAQPGPLSPGVPLPPQCHRQPPSTDSALLLFQIGSSDAGWTLGYMLNLTNMIPAEEPAEPPLSHGSYVGLMVLCSLVLVSVLLFTWLLFHKPKCLQKGIV